MKINGLQLYLVYQKYWISRKYIDLIGFNFLTNNIIMINKYFKYKDLGAIKVVAWSMLGIKKEISGYKYEDLVKDFYEKLEACPYKENILHHFNMIIDGLKSRMWHWGTCKDALAEFNSMLKTSLIDNIYNINSNLGLYTPNFFEEKLIENILQYNEFVSIIKENIKNITIENIEYFDISDKYTI